MVSSVSVPTVPIYFSTNDMDTSVNTTINGTVYMGGYNNSTGKRVVGVSLHFGSMTLSDSFRVSLYSGGSADAPGTAVLIKDFGELSATLTDAFGTITLIVADYFTLPSNTYLWLGIKSNDLLGAAITTTTAPADSGSFQSIRGIYSESTTDPDPSIAWDTLLPAGGTFSGVWFYGRILLQETIPNPVLSVNNSESLQESDETQLIIPDDLKVQDSQQLHQSSTIALVTSSTTLDVDDSSQFSFAVNISLVNAIGKMRVNIT